MIADLVLPRQRLRAILGACCSLFAASAMACASHTSTTDNNANTHATVPSVVTLTQTKSGWQLVRNGEPFFIKGAGGGRDLDKLVAAGGNSIRTWDAEGIGDLLDRAHERGIAVAVGIWLDHERHGHDYDKPEQREKQLARVRRLVNEWKDHPAVLLWGVGNEVELEGDMDKALRAIEEAAALIKQLDPNHPTMSVTAEIGDDKAKRIAAECPSIDILGVNSYAGVGSLPQRLAGQGVPNKPYVVTEFGPRGHWESAHTDWGAPIEPSSAEKFDMYRQHYANGIAAAPGRCLGSYVFLWGNKQEVTYSWYGMFLASGEATPTVDAMSLSWNGELPDQRAPLVGPIRLAGGPHPRVKPGDTCRGRVDVRDPDGDTLRYEWQVIAESRDRRTGGDDEQAPPEIDTHLRTEATDKGERVTFTAPEEPGPYRLYLVVYDGTGRAGTANVPFFVEDN